MKTVRNDAALSRTIKGITGFRLHHTGELCFFRYKFERPEAPEGLSKEHNIGFINWRGGAAVAVITEFRRGTWINAFRLRKPELRHDCKILYQANVGSGDRVLRNVDEIFYFAKLPPEIASKPTVKERVNDLAQWVSDQIQRERKEFRSKTATLEQERKKKAPARLPHEPPGVDHYENQKNVVTALLRKYWPRLSLTMDQLTAATSESEKQKQRKEVTFAYIADYTNICGERPAVRKEEEALLWQDDSFIGLMHAALNAPKANVDKRDWQLANGWIEKNYYRMNEEQLEKAFANDWGYKRKIKGNTLARRARRIGLLSALKRGRREIHKFDDRALEMRTT